MRKFLAAGLVVVGVFASCGGNGGPTVPPTGSCCELDGTCTIGPATACDGTWVGDGECQPNPCPLPPPPDMVLIPAGSFIMGSPADEPGRNQWGDQETQHEVVLTRPFYISDHEVTQAEWYAVTNLRPSHFSGDELPVEQVSWFDAIEYCNQRSVDEGLTPVYTLREVERNDSHITDAVVSMDRDSPGYRLPTEAEWEYACRAGSTSAFFNGAIVSDIDYECSEDSTLNLVGWYCGNASATTHPAGGKAANAWALRDMHGNVSEWCWDRMGEYPTGPVTDPPGPSWGTHRVFRGGCWAQTAQFCRSADRLHYLPDSHDYGKGLRVVRGVQ